MKILITGATGYIGEAVARKLLQRGHEVLAISRSKEAVAKLRGAGLTPVAGDFPDRASRADPESEGDPVVSPASLGRERGPQEGFAQNGDAGAVMTKPPGKPERPRALIMTATASRS